MDAEVPGGDAPVDGGTGEGPETATGDAGAPAEGNTDVTV